LLNCLVDTLGSLPLIAENLGVITPGVEAMRKRFRLPGMHVLQFAFDGTAANPHLPRHHEVQGVVYTGTHDNDTSRGWWESLTVEAREAVRETLHSEEAMPDALIHVALASRSRLCMIPLQDLLGLGSEARMNTPGRADGQWRWQFSWQQLADSGTALWRQALSESGRT
jgi:4-alpha-glucanotransferase